MQFILKAAAMPHYLKHGSPSVRWSERLTLLEKRSAYSFR